MCCYSDNYYNYYLTHWGWWLVSQDGRLSSPLIHFTLTLHIQIRSTAIKLCWWLLQTFKHVQITILGCNRVRLMTHAFSKFAGSYGFERTSFYECVSFLPWFISSKKASMVCTCLVIKLVSFKILLVDLKCIFHLLADVN